MDARGTWIGETKLWFIGFAISQIYVMCFSMQIFHLVAYCVCPTASTLIKKVSKHLIGSIQSPSPLSLHQVEAQGNGLYLNIILIYCLEREKNLLLADEEQKEIQISGKYSEV